MKLPLRTDSFTSYSLDRFAARPWNQSSRLREEGKLIPVEAQVQKPAEGFTVSCRLLAEVCGLWTLDSAAIRTIFQIQSQMLISIFFFLVVLGVFSDKVLLACSVAAGRREIKKIKKQQLEIAFDSDGHLASEALLPIHTRSLPCCASILSTLFFYSLCPPITEPLLLSCPQAQSQIDMLNSQVGH